MFDFSPPIELHKELNPKLWQDGHLRPKVREALIKISRVYYKFLGTDAPLIDIVISGSQANYNFTNQSDLDLHLIIPFHQVTCDMDVAEYFDTKRKLWKEQHNITIYGIPVELYAENTEEPAVSATYSILENDWIDPPPPPASDYDVKGVAKEMAKWSQMIDAAVESKNLSMCEKVKDMLSQYRKKGLATDGEYGIANLTFKGLRNSNKIKLLMGTIRYLGDKELSL